MTTIKVSAYTVYPTGYDDATFADKYLWTITVEATGNGLWAVRKRGIQCLNREDDWQYEPTPSNRDDEFLEQCRFTEEDALRRAEAVVDRIRINGSTIAEADVGVAARLAVYERGKS